MGRLARATPWCVACSLTLVAFGCTESSSTVDETDGAPGTETAGEAGVPRLATDYALLQVGVGNRDRFGHDQPHFGPLVIAGDAVHVANSFDGLTSFEARGADAVDVATVWTREPATRVTTIAYHAGTERLYGSAPDTWRILSDSDGRSVVDAFDVRSPWDLEVDEQRATVFEHEVSLMVVQGDTLWAGTLTDGLHTRRIDPETGALSDDGRRGLPGERVFAVDQATPDTLVAAVEGRGVVLVAGADGEPEVLDEAFAPQPLLDVHGGAGIVGAACGSFGARVWELGPDGGTLSAEAELAPHDVVAAIALHGTDDGRRWAALAGAAGVWVYDVTELATPELVAFTPSHYTALDVAWRPLPEGDAGDDGAVAELWVSDWEIVRRLRFRPGLPVGPPDRQRTVVVQPGQDAVVHVRAPEDPAMGERVVRLRGDDMTVPTLAVGTLRSGQVTALRIPADVLADTAAVELDLGRAVNFWVEVEGYGVDGLSWFEEAPYRSYSTVLVARPSPDGATWKRPAPGQPMPPMRLDDLDDGATWLPAAGEGAMLAFFGSDCTAVWPMLRDVVARRDAGLEDPERPWIFADDVPGPTRVFLASWGLPESDMLVSNEATATAGPDDQLYGRWLYTSVLELPGLPGTAMHPTNYQFGPDGRVEAVERTYRGPYAWPHP